MLTLNRLPAARRGMTMIELVVAMTIIAILTTLVVVYIVPSFQDNKNVIRGVDRVTTALLIAKQRALRDQAPRGVRFIQDPTLPSPGPLLFQQLQYIEQPDPLSGGTLVVTSTTAGSTQIMFNGVDFLGGADNTSVDEFDVQPGDYFRCQGANYLIAGPLNARGFPSRTQLQLVRQHGLATAIPLANTPWQIIRQTRPISGESPINLPQNVVVDLAQVANLVSAGIVQSSTQIPSRAITNLAGTPSVTYFEILFSSTGGVINNQGSSSNIALVVRDVTADPPPAASGFILDPNTARVIGITPRTGLLAAHPVHSGNQINNNLVTYALDGLSSGL